MAKNNLLMGAPEGQPFFFLFIGDSLGTASDLSHQGAGHGKPPGCGDLGWRSDAEQLGPGPPQVGPVGRGRQEQEVFGKLFDKKGMCMIFHEGVLISKNICIYIYTYIYRVIYVDKE